MRTARRGASHRGLERLILRYQFRIFLRYRGLMCAFIKSRMIESMMSFPSQTQRSPFSRFLRIGVGISCLMILLASIAGFTYALWPAKDLGSVQYGGTPSAQSANFQRQNPRALGDHYGNGQIPVIELQQISKGHYLVPVAAEEFTRLQAALRAAGHELKINSSYRTLAEQEGLIKRYGLLSAGGTAAPVGQSDHGLGLSVDVKLDGNALRWMSDHAGEYGFKNTVAGEPWHWTFTN